MESTNTLTVKFVGFGGGFMASAIKIWSLKKHGQTDLL